MRAVLQRVSSARVVVDGNETGKIAHGILALVGVEQGDGPDDVVYVANKIRELRIFEDAAGKMNRSLVDVGGSALVVSQFTLAGDCRNGRRPSFIAAAAPAEAQALYEGVIASLRESGVTVGTGIFRAMMQVELVNDGPVTLLIDSRKRF
jgi:D-tyrosyl-tRNA(Tyr) deacylase